MMRRKMKDNILTFCVSVLALVNVWGVVLFQDFKDDMKNTNKVLIEHITDHDLHGGKG